MKNALPLRGQIELLAMYRHEFQNILMHLARSVRRDFPILLRPSFVRSPDYPDSYFRGLNSGGSTWVVFEDYTPKKSFFKTPDDKFYTLLRNGTNLEIMTEAMYMKAEQKVLNTKQASIQNSK